MALATTAGVGTAGGGPRPPCAGLGEAPGLAGGTCSAEVPIDECFRCDGSLTTGDGEGDGVAAGLALEGEALAPGLGLEASALAAGLALPAPA